MSKESKTTENAQGAKSEMKPYEGKKEFTLKASVGRREKGDKVSISYDMAIIWKLKGFI